MTDTVSIEICGPGSLAELVAAVGPIVDYTRRGRPVVDLGRKVFATVRFGVLTRSHDDDLPTIEVPEPLIVRAARLVANTADLVHRGCPRPNGVAEDVRPHLHKTLDDDAGRLRALIPTPGRRPGATLWAVPDAP